jgi:RNA polymerase primary sigma factor
MPKAKKPTDDDPAKAPSSKKAAPAKKASAGKTARQAQGKQVAPEPISPEELKQQLIDKAKKDGHISQREIFKVIPETPENAEVLDALYTELADSSVEITATEPNEAGFEKEWVADDDEEEEIVVKEGVYLDDDVADDSVRLYLREIGKIPLLNAEEELALAQRVVAGEQKA